MLRIDSVQHNRSNEHQKVLMKVALHLKSSNRPTVVISRTLENNRIQLEEIDETASVLYNSITVLKEDVQRVQNELISEKQKLDSITNEFSKLRISDQEQNSSVNNIQINQETCEQELTLIRQRMNEKKTWSCDGTLLWNIDNVQGKIGQHFILFRRNIILWVLFMKVYIACMGRFQFIKKVESKQGNTPRLN